MDSSNGKSSTGAGERRNSMDLAQAFKDIARGEETARSLEASLTSLEQKLDAMLAAFEAQEHQAADETSNNSIKVEVKEEVEAKEIEPEETEMKTGDMKQEDIEKKM